MVENSELARQTRHYLAVRERLARPGDAAGRSAGIELEGQLADLASDNEAKGRWIARLEADLADAGARLLAQARILLGGRDTGASNEDGGDRAPIEEIVAAVLEDFPGVSWDDIISVRRERRLVKPRHACMRAVYERRRDLSLAGIGRIFHRDHTTVLAVVNDGGAGSGTASSDDTFSRAWWRARIPYPPSVHLGYRPVPLLHGWSSATDVSITTLERIPMFHKGPEIACKAQGTTRTAAEGQCRALCLRQDKAGVI